MSWESNVRSSLIVLWEPPWSGPFEKGRCTWCGEAIELRDPVMHYRQRQRTIHYGDEIEVEGSPGCARSRNRSRVWSARDALLALHREFSPGEALGCARCGVVVENADETDGVELVPWEADHIVALVDGGAHEVENFQVLCWRCHRAKTAEEARARAGGRARADPMQLGLGVE